ncbi:bifunctional folylpolyglutamate synthase/dihydrofolate synthase [Lactonifactor longoviformis]|uniref:bifunctional folylpolyglutamate synthase/dihydrofolate synthase n=1 Tax=Lactonifactor longoviformis TaxID=341220 RepID=UPI001D02D384|nr:folylpolyglutamate synthase/dihydrofolate synthase family protein [Lactonifactor longoviformis]MCB5712202.1 bifunctional folylpolyglutamate synthase/dihydrofolate synthase [Lactonifactor longoviformis]MCB5716246.1 bifunctional folylpolyglutamate synthase/dihydrofolate synthase [Lactonifactor longoviformis]
MFTYEEAVEYIEEIPKFTKKNKLEHTKECLRRLGNPGSDKKIIHVAGTNGKGSVCAFLASMLRQGGCVCGLFTSPHLVEINERFQIDEVPVDNQLFLEAFIKVKELSDELLSEGSYHPTYFEFLFLMGMWIFCKTDVEYIILETGLGGRLDATNSIARPLACVITSVSLDHTEYLGDTVTAIAGEKAGIIKNQVPVIYDGNLPASSEVIKKRAESLESLSCPVTEDQISIHRIAAEGIDFSWKSGYYQDVAVRIPFIARYQVMNAALAMKVMEVLKNIHKIPVEALVEGIAVTRWQGRMETVLPGVIVDGAHNEDGVARFVETVSHFEEEYPVTLLFSAVSDKDYEDMIREICSGLSLSGVVTTEVGGYRAVSAGRLAEVFRENACETVYACPNIEHAFEKACDLKKEGMLFCAGSLYLVGEIKDYIRRRVHD